MSTDHAVFLLEKLKYKATLELEDRVKRHLTEVFKYKVLPKIIDDIKEKLIIDLVNSENDLEIKIHIKGEE